MNRVRCICVAALAVALTACGGGGSGGDTSAPTTNSAPTANAGTAQNVMTATLITLNGSASSDANGDPLTYIWTLTSKPAGSIAVLAGTTTAAPTFTADAAGTYVASLVVNDGKVSSVASTVTVTATVANAAPVANAGTAQNVTTATLVTLNGSASSDANGDPLTYIWTLTSRPAGSAATLVGATSATPTFSADAAGTYGASLVVNDGKVSSTASTVTVTATVANAAPVANAGTAQNVTTATLVTLNGSASSDANGDPLTYIWTLPSRPAGSTATLAGATSAAPTFTADAAGTYVASLVVNDGKVSSTASTVMVTAAVANVAPVANAGPGQNVLIANVVTLDGSASSDANGDPLTFAWSLTSRPAGSAAALNSTTSAKPTFTADVAGTYVATLIVNDGTVSSSSATVAIKAGTPVSGLVNASVTWSTPNSPYVLVGRLMIPGGVALTIDPGVEVIGNGNEIQTEGSLLVNGTTGNRVLLTNVAITPAGKQTSNHLISIKGASVNGGSLYAPTGNAIYGNLVLTDSRLSNTSAYMYLWYPTGTSTIERNYFSGTGGISFGLSGAPVSLTIRNNAFINWSGAAVENWAMYSGATANVSLNSFLSTDRNAALLRPGYTDASLNAANNYWGTTVTSVIDAMIFDKNDDLTSNGFVNYIPILTAPDPATPQ